jgi:L-fucose isomerase-like protein
MLDYKVKIGLAPTRRVVPGNTGTYKPEYAINNKKKFLEYIRKNFSEPEVEFVDLDFLNEEGIMYDISQAEAIAEKFIEAKVDGLFIINCNFGCEEVAGKVAHLLKKPTLIWGPRDTLGDDQLRYCDSQCGLFAISRQLQRFGLPFSYIENCNIEAEVFRNGLDDFFAIACMVKNFQSLRIAQVGTRPKLFKSVMSNEAELMEKFGIEVVPVNLAVVGEKLNRIMSEKAVEIKKDVAEVKRLIDVGKFSDAILGKTLAFKYVYQEIVQETHCQIIASECWGAMPVAFDVMPCLAISLLGDEGLYVVCEADIYGAITTALLACAARGKSHPLFGEFLMRHPGNDNAELLGHCGNFPYTARNPGIHAKLHNKAQSCWEGKPGHYTIARFEMARGRTYLLAGECQTVEGPKTMGTYLWAEFADYAKWEKKLMEGPYIHHVTEIEGSYSRVIKEFCKYVPGLIFDSPELP